MNFMKIKLRKKIVPLMKPFILSAILGALATAQKIGPTIYDGAWDQEIAALTVTISESFIP